MKIEVESFKEPQKAFDILHRLKAYFKQYAIIQPEPPPAADISIGEVKEKAEEKQLTLTQMCISQAQRAVVMPEDFELLQKAIVTYHKSMSELMAEYVAEERVIKRINRYSSKTDSFINGLEKAARTQESLQLEEYIQASFNNTAKAVEEYIRAIESEPNIHRKNAYYRAIGIINDVLGAAGIYSPGADNGKVDERFYRVFSLTENNDESLSGNVSQYYCLAYVNSSGQILATGEVAMYE